MENMSHSILSLEKLYFDKISYSRKEIELPPQMSYEMHFNRGIDLIDGSKYKVSLTAEIKSENEAVEISATIIGVFVCECDDEKLKNTLVKDNTIAIMFPYLRSQISLVSTQPDFAPVILPAINVIELFKDAE